MLVNGSLVVEIVERSMHNQKMSNVKNFLKKIDLIYSDKVINRRAEEIIYSN